MRTLLTASLAGLLLSSAATAQDDWTYLQCDIQQTTIRTEGGTPVRGEPWSADLPEIWRFNATSMDNFMVVDEVWRSPCHTHEIGTAELRCRVVYGGGQQWDITINRQNGRWTSLWLNDSTDPAGRRTEGEGRCTRTSDPLAGRGF